MNKINLGLQPAKYFVEKAKEDKDPWGKTEQYSTGDEILDEYLGNSITGGYGRKYGYEIICVFGDTGMNKSTLASSMIIDPAAKGYKVGYFALEDDPKDVVKRIRQQCNDTELYNKAIENISFLPESDGYTLNDMAEAVEQLFELVDIILIDPIQFIYEASVEERGETEFNRQRLFMRKMNNLMKRTNKTLILVSHTNKQSGKYGNKGVDRIIGSSAIAQVSTKVIEISRRDDGSHGLRLWKSRFTPYRYCGVQIRLDNMRVRTVYDKKDLPEARENWSGGLVISNN